MWDETMTWICIGTIVSTIEDLNDALQFSMSKIYEAYNEPPDVSNSTWNCYLSLMKMSHKPTRWSNASTTLKGCENVIDFA
jgi:hypothetical protein